MAEISNADIYDVLLTLKGDLGELKGTMTAQAKTLSEHIIADAGMAADIQKIKLSQARQRGIIGTLSAVGTGLGVAVGYAIDLLTLRGHH